MISKKQAATLRSLITKRAKAEADHSWRGAQDLEVREEIEEELAETRLALNKFIDKLTEATLTD